MAKAAIIFNGIQLSFPVIDRAFVWAKQSNGSLLAIFLKAKSEAKEGYIFPSDLDSAENLTSNEEAETNHIKVIDSNIRILEHQASSEHIELQTQLLTDPTEEELMEHFTGCERIFIQKKIDQQGILAVDSIDLKRLLKNPPVPTEVVQG